MLRSSREQPKPEAPGSKSTPGWQPNLRQEARQSQSGRNRFWQFQLSLGMLQLVKVVKFPLYIGQLFLQSALHRCTRLQAVPSQPQESSDLTEFESQALYAADEGQRLYVVFCIPTEASLCPGRPRKQPFTLIKADRINA